MWQGLLQWLEDFILQLENAEKPSSPLDVSNYQDGYNQGCLDTQELILKKLKYAIDVERRIISND